MFKLIIKNYLAATDMDVQSLKYEGKYEQYIETLNEAAMTFYEGLLKSLTNAYIGTEEYLRDQENGRVEDTLGKKKIQAQEAAKAFIEQSIFGEPEEIEEISKEITEDEIKLKAIMTTSTPSKVEMVINKISTDPGVISITWEHEKETKTDNEDSDYE